MTDRTVTLTRRIAASVDAVYAAWTTESGLRTWYAPVDGWVVGDATVDARVGGSYRVTFGPAPAGDAYIEQGTYTVVEPGARLVWNGTVTGDADGENDESHIEVTFTPDGDGTLLTVVEKGLSPDAADMHEQGWSEALDRLDVVLAPGTAG